MRSSRRCWGVFDEVIGQEQVKTLLARSISADRVAQAYIFYGPPGVGKKTLARAFVRALLCEAPPGEKACGRCRSCRLADAGAHPDMHTVVTDGATIGIAEVRRLRQSLRYKPYGRRHVTLVAPAEALTAEAGNALLKTLEEPTGEAVFLFVAARPEQVLPTIFSRCLRVSLRRLTQEEVAAGLTARLGIEPATARTVAALADGSLGRALELAAGPDRVRETAVALAAGAGRDYRVWEQVAGSRDSLQQHLEMLLLWYRDLMVWQETQAEDLLINADRVAQIKEQAGWYGEGGAAAAVLKVAAARQKLMLNANPRLVADVLSLQLGRLRIGSGTIDR
ncbi:MAG: DNA polymerase III, delta prime subunit [Clostridia bacterium 62_21]|nr:MAG: DNA polymerase III, delta prime subunit [Clostridia bacterium 62_21]